NPVRNVLSIPGSISFGRGRMPDGVANPVRQSDGNLERGLNARPGAVQDARLGELNPHTISKGGKLHEKFQRNSFWETI
ncbi:MAG: hypothetical protein DRI57_03900, partial [Deltaproteobacteria bacterium]